MEGQTRLKLNFLLTFPISSDKNMQNLKKIFYFSSFWVFFNILSIFLAIRSNDIRSFKRIFNRVEWGKKYTFYRLRIFMKRLTIRNQIFENELFVPPYPNITINIK